MSGAHGSEKHTIIYTHQIKAAVTYVTCVICQSGDLDMYIYHEQDDIANQSLF